MLKTAKRIALLAKDKWLDRIAQLRNQWPTVLFAEDFAAEDIIVDIEELLLEQARDACGKCVEDCKSGRGAIERSVFRRLKYRCSSYFPLSVLVDVVGSFS